MPSQSDLNTAPRGLRRVAAARYLGISATHFDKQVKVGSIPPPREMFGVTLWDRTKLDALFEGGAQAHNDNEWDSVLRHEETETRPRIQ